MRCGNLPNGEPESACGFFASVFRDRATEVVHEPRCPVDTATLGSFSEAVEDDHEVWPDQRTVLAGNFLGSRLGGKSGAHLVAFAAVERSNPLYRSHLE